MYQKRDGKLFSYENVAVTFHRPHDQKEAKVYQVQNARRFLEEVGITP